jgi:hypothetical protein
MSSFRESFIASGKQGGGAAVLWEGRDIVTRETCVPAALNINNLGKAPELHLAWSSHNPFLKIHYTGGFITSADDACLGVEPGWLWWNGASLGLPDSGPQLFLSGALGLVVVLESLCLSLHFRKARGPRSRLTVVSCID